MIDGGAQELPLARVRGAPTAKINFVDTTSDLKIDGADVHVVRREFDAGKLDSDGEGIPVLGCRVVFCE